MIERGTHSDGPFLKHMSHKSGLNESELGRRQEAYSDGLGLALKNYMGHNDG